MARHYKDIIKHSAIYGVGELLLRLASFLLLPVYTAYLRPADYGVIAILDLAGGVVAILIGTGLAQAVVRFHFDNDDERARDRVWWTGLGGVLFFSALIVGPGILFRDTVARVTLGDGHVNGGTYYLLMFTTTVLGSFGVLLDSYLRVQKRSVLLVSLAMTRLLLNIALNLYFLISLGWGIQGVLTGNLLATAAMTTAVFVVFARSRGRPVVDRPIAKELFAFCWPLMVTLMLALVMHQADRYLLRLFLDMDRVGIYSLAYMIGQGVNTLVLVPFASIWGVAIYEIARTPEPRKVYAQTYKYFVYALMSIMLALALLAKPIIDLMAADDYADAAEIIPIVALAYVFFSMHEHFKVPAMLAKKTVSLIPSSLAAAIVNVVANIALIPRLGPAGAAWASVLTFLTFSFCGLYMYRRIDKYHYPFGRLAVTLAVLCGVYFVSTRLLDWEAHLIRSLALAFCIWLAVAGTLFGPLIMRWKSGRLTAAALETAE